MSTIDKLQREVNELKDKVNKYSSLLDISRVINTLTDLKTLLKAIVEYATSVSDTDRGSIFLIDQERKELWTITALGTEQEIRIPINKGIAGYVATTGEILNIKDAYLDPRFNKEVDLKTNYRTRNILCLPILNKYKTIIGVLQLINKKSGEFTELDIEIMTAFTQQVSIAIENTKLYEEQLKLHEELKKTFNSLIETLATSIDAKHKLTAGHSKRVMEYSLQIAKSMNLSEEEVENIRIAALLHDAGKIGIPDDVLTKPGKLTDQEYEIMKTHALKTKEILDKIYFPPNQRDIPLIASSHHEKVNGKGYPYNLKEEQIPLGGKIIAVADVFDALTSERDYRKPMTKEEALDILKKEAGTHFDPEIVEIFIKLQENSELIKNKI